MGGIDPGESSATAAARELYEETGTRCADLRECGWFYALPGLSNQQVHVFSGSASDEDVTRPFSAQREEDLDHTVPIPVDRLGDIYREGRITDSLTLCSLIISGYHFS